MKITTMLFILFLLTVVLTAVGFGVKIAAVLCGIVFLVFWVMYYLDLDLRGK